MKASMHHPLPVPTLAEVPDNGRRGNPLPGCDCVQCFGRCMVDPDAKERDTFRRADEGRRAGRDEGASL